MVWHERNDLTVCFSFQFIFPSMFLFRILSMLCFLLNRANWGFLNKLLRLLFVLTQNGRYNHFSTKKIPLKCKPSIYQNVLQECFIDCFLSWLRQTCFEPHFNRESFRYLELKNQMPFSGVMNYLVNELIGAAYNGGTICASQPAAPGSKLGAPNFLIEMLSILFLECSSDCVWHSSPP